MLEVFVPGAIVSTHRKQALSAFGPVPFPVVCLQSHLWSFNPAHLPVAPELTQNPPQPISTSQVIDRGSADGVEDLVADSDGIPVGGLLLNDLTDPPKDLPHIIDGASSALRMKILGNIPKAPETWDNQI